MGLLFLLCGIGFYLIYRSLKMDPSSPLKPHYDDWITEKLPGGGTRSYKKPCLKDGFNRICCLCPKPHLNQSCCVHDRMDEGKRF